METANEHKNKGWIETALICMFIWYFWKENVFKLIDDNYGKS